MEGLMKLRFYEILLSGILIISVVGSSSALGYEKPSEKKERTEVVVNEKKQGKESKSSEEAKKQETNQEGNK